MLKRKKQIIAKVMATTMLASTLASTFATNVNAAEPQTKATVSETTISGDDRYKTAVEISKNYSSTSKHAVIVNGQQGIVDALTATPYASLKKAPILMTQSTKLNEDTKKELTRRGVKTVDIVGGVNSVSDSVKAEIEAMGITVNRIAGDSKYDTALEVAKKIDDISDISKIAVANGEVLADAVSVAAPAAQNKMPIILAHPTKGLDAETKKYIDSQEVSKSYVIGGTSSVSTATQNSLPGTKKRLEGTDRQGTNASVIKEFYTSSSYDNMYVAKSGQVNKADEIADALAVGVLAASNQDPVMLVGKSLGSTQKTLLESKDLEKITKVGGNIPTASIDAIKNTQSSTKTVTTVAELKTALTNAKDGDIINFNPSTTVSEAVSLSTTKNVTVNLNGSHSGSVSVDMASGTLNINGNISNKVSVDAVKSINVKSGVTVKHLEIKSGAKNSNISNNGTVTTFDVLATGVKITGSGKITTLNPQGDTDYSGFKGEISNLDTTKPVSQVVAQNAKELVIRFSKQIDKSSIIDTDGTLVNNKITLTKSLTEQEVDAYKASLDDSRMVLTITATTDEIFDGTYRIDIDGINSNGIELDQYSTTFTADDKTSPTVDSMTFNVQEDKFEITLSEPIDNLADLVLRVNNTSVNPIEMPKSGTKISTTKKLTIDRKSTDVALNNSASIYIAGLKDSKGNIMTSKTQSVSTTNSTIKVDSISTISDNKIKLVFTKKLNDASEGLIKAKTGILVFKKDDSGKSQQIDIIELDETDQTDRTYIITLKESIFGDDSSKTLKLTIADKAYKDETGTEIAKYESSDIKLTKDTTAPTVKSTVVTSDKKAIEVTFSEDIELNKSANSAGSKMFRVVRSGAIKTDDYTVEMKENSKNTILIKQGGTKLDAGVYNINLAQGIVNDMSINRNVNKTVSLDQFTISANVEDPLVLGDIANETGKNKFSITAPAGEKFTLDSLNYKNFEIDGETIHKDSFIHYDTGVENKIIINLPESDSINVSPTAELTVKGLKLQSGKAIKVDSEGNQKKDTVEVVDNTAPDLSSAAIKMDYTNKKVEVKLTFSEKMNTVIDGITMGSSASEEQQKSNLQALKDELIIKIGSGTSLASYNYFSTDKAIVTVDGKVITIIIAATEGSNLFNVIKDTRTSVTIETKTGNSRKIKDANNVVARAEKTASARPTATTIE